MGAARQARGRLTALVAAAAATLLIATALILAQLTADSAQHAGPTQRAETHRAVESPSEATESTSITLVAWSRPTTQNAAYFAHAFASAIWTYDTHVPYASWSKAIGGWADPLGNPASSRVAMSMLPPVPTYEGLRAQSATATAGITSVAVPRVADQLASRAPKGWHVFVVRGTQHIQTATGRYETARQVSVATVCDPTCWLYSATPELPE